MATTLRPWDDVLDRLDVLAFYGSEHIDLRQSGNYFKGLCPFHDDHQSSLSVSDEPGKKGLFKCHACSAKGSPFDFYMKQHNVSFKEALVEVAKYAPGVVVMEYAPPAIPAPAAAAGPKPRAKVVATYDYVDEQGAVLFQSVRFEPKDFRQRISDGNGGWKYGIAGVRRVLYHLDEVHAAVEAGKTIFVCEGEKDADALRAMGMTATTNPMGAGKWLPEYTASLAGATVVLLPDNDTVGRDHMYAVARALFSAGCTVKIIELPGLPAKGDVSDWLRIEEHEPSDLAALFIRTPDFEPRVDGPVIVKMSEVIATDVDWLWEGRFPLGKVSLIIGDPGLGKSTMTLDMIARITRGLAWPDYGTARLGNVIILTAEDGLDDTVAPRLLKAGADMERVLALTAIRTHDKEQFFSLETDLAHLESAIIKHQPVAVFIDPVTAYMGKNTDSHVDTEVRAILGPLAALADRYHVSVFCVMHLNKTTKVKSLYRVGGSIGFVAAARAVFAVAPDPDDPLRRFLLPVKMNLAAPPPVLAFNLGEQLDWERDPVAGKDLEALLSGEKPKRDSRVDVAMAFLEEELAEGVMTPSVDVLRHAKEQGISADSVNRAKKAMGHVVSRKIVDSWYMTIERRQGRGAIQPDPPEIP